MKFARCFNFIGQNFIALRSKHYLFLRPELFPNVDYLDGVFVSIIEEILIYSEMNIYRFKSNMVRLTWKISYKVLDLNLLKILFEADYGDEVAILLFSDVFLKDQEVVEYIPALDVL
jgi:hypothetical protein